MWQLHADYSNIEYLWRAFRLNFPPFILAAFLGYAAIELFGDRTIETIQALAITPDPVKAGTTATIVYQGHQDNNCDGIVHRYVVDSANTLIQLDDANVFHHDIDPNNPDKLFTFTKPLPVPASLVPGPAVYHATALRWCNSFQQFLWPVRDVYIIKFNVAK